ncbi:MAG: KEOPS complex kinase/ATPase Bud32 [Nanoarchaeota archaeon]|nr:KEOPS complex kinase/ATPase Bud32 [Nanoarchaeota archaeon]
MNTIIGQGAEATIYLAENVIKERLEKSYRLEEIDASLRKTRTRKEAKLLEKLQKISFPAPKLISTDKLSRIEMEYLKGPKLRDFLDEKNHRMQCIELGRKIAVLHNNDIIHGDLTTSNMIVNDEIFFIDFGLSFHSAKVEDKAVDLHLLRQAFDSKHFDICEGCFAAALEGYEKESSNAKEIFLRLDKVETRGRNKGKG